MTRKHARSCCAFFGSLHPQYRGTWSIDNRSVSRGTFKRAWMAASGQPFHQSAPLGRRRGVRARKAAVLARRPLVGCWHEYRYHEDTIGDYGVVNGTYTERWLKCDLCGDEQPASWEDAPSYDDY
jgi:hypothetical protein